MGGGDIFMEEGGKFEQPEKIVQRSDCPKSISMPKLDVECTSLK